MTTKRTARNRSKQAPRTIHLSEVKAEDLKRITGGNRSDLAGLQGTCGSEGDRCGQQPPVNRR
jgi:hypothetical protein